MAKERDAAATACDAHRQVSTYVRSTTDRALFDVQPSAMARMMDQLKAGSPVFGVENAGDCFVLVAVPERCQEFSDLVRDLLNQGTDEFVILPVTDGADGYDRAIIIPY